MDRTAGLFMLNWRLSILGAFALILVALPVSAQPRTLLPTEPRQIAQTAPAPLPTDYDAAFRAMIADPANLDLTFRFAELAIAAGDLEGAVSAFERLLIFNPDLPRIRYELGKLYMRLGSEQMAKGYFEDAARAPDLPPAFRADIAQNLAEIEKRQSPYTIAVALQAGLRWQSNANAANSAGIVKLFGFDADLDPTSRKRADWNAFAQATAAFVYDFGTQDRDTLEAGLQLYGTRQFDVSSLDLQVAQVDIGPRLRFDGADGWSLRPYLIASAVTLDNPRYLYSYGGGVSADVPLSDRLALDLDFRSRLRDFHATATRTTVAAKDGWEYGARFGVRYALGAGEQIRLGAGGARTDARAAYERNKEFGADLTYLRQFAPLWGLGNQPWIGILSGGRTLRYYDGPDPSIDPDATRNDREWTVGAGLVARVSGGWSVNVQLLQSWVRSSLANYTYTNTSASIGIGYAF
jgi:tetratricopeptide (TPR) repeat protein